MTSDPDVKKDFDNYSLVQYGASYQIRGTKARTGYEVGIGDYIVSTNDMKIEDAGKSWHLTGHGGRMSPDYCQIWIPKSLVIIRWDYGLHAHHSDFLSFKITVPNWFLDKGIKTYHASRDKSAGMHIVDFLKKMEIGTIDW